MWLLIVDLLFVMVAICFSLFGHSAMYYCGQLENKPHLALDMSPSWFNRNFQINKGYVEIISNNKTGKPFFDKFVKGSDLFKEILRYNINPDNHGLFFVALNWEGESETFLLRDYPSSSNGGYVYEVIKQDSIDLVKDWVVVSDSLCRTVSFRIYLYVWGVSLMIINALLLGKQMVRRGHKTGIK